MTSCHTQTLTLSLERPDLVFSTDGDDGVEGEGVPVHGLEEKDLGDWDWNQFGRNGERHLKFNLKEQRSQRGQLGRRWDDVLLVNYLLKTYPVRRRSF